MEFKAKNKKLGYVTIKISDEDADLAVRPWHLAGGKAGKGEPGKYVAGRDGILLHRIVAHRMGLLESVEPIQGLRGSWSVSIDHENGDKMDCRRENLRLRDRPQQMTNLNDGMRTTNTSGFRGVSRVAAREQYGKPWMASITENGTTINLGWYVTAEDAAEARRDYEAAQDKAAWREAHRKERDLGNTGQRGVVCVKGRYYARAFLNGKSVHLGAADSVEEATAIRQSFAESPDKDAWLREHIRTAPQPNGSSGYRGVALQGRRWQAYVNVKGKRINLGRYDEPEEAVAARRAWDEANARLTDVVAAVSDAAPLPRLP